MSVNVPPVRSQLRVILAVLLLLGIAAAAITGQLLNPMVLLILLVGLTILPLV